MKKVLFAAVAAVFLAAGCAPAEQPVTKNVPPPGQEQADTAAPSASADPDDFNEYLIQASAEEETAVESDDSDLIGIDSAELDAYAEVTNEVQF